MSTQAMILMIFLFLLITVCVVFTIRKLLSGKEAQRKEYHNQRKNILVQNGIDVKKQMLGSGKGEYFSGNLREYDTNYVNGPIYSTWKISFQNLATGRIYQYRFRKQLQSEEFRYKIVTHALCWMVTQRFPKDIVSFTRGREDFVWQIRIPVTIHT